MNFRKAFQILGRVCRSICCFTRTIAKMFVDYKLMNQIFIPQQLAIGDYHYYMQQSSMQCRYTLVDSRPHLPGANIEQIVSLCY
jgi:L-rhamnose isomerase